MQTIKDFNVLNKICLVRVDFNVPLNEQGQVLDNFRIQSSLATIIYLLENNAKIVLISHLGRPLENQKSKVSDSKNQKYSNQKYSLKPVALELRRLLKRRVLFLEDCLGEDVKKAVASMKSGEIILLENLRFYKEEEINDPDFAQKIAELGDVYINDAFAICHRNHASIVGVPKYLPSAAGLLLEKEIKVLTDLMKNPKKPLVVIIGGKKVETKIKLINKIAQVADFVLIGGLIKKELKEKNIQLKEPQKIVEPIGDIYGKDINPQTINLFKEKIALAKTIFWNGPLGFVEDKLFAKGSEAIVQAVIKSSAFSVIGGGDTIKLLKNIDLKSIGHISTGGGAMLSFLSGQKLPGVQALKS